MTESRGVGEVLGRLAALETRQRGRSFDSLRRGLLAGDREAWEHLVEKYSRFVYAVALRLLHGNPEREETAAAVYCGVFERLAADRYAVLRRFEGRCRFSTYLYRVVQSEKKERLRRRGAPAIDTARQAEDPEDDASTTPVLRPERIERAVRAALERLETEDRLVLAYRFRDGLKLREIAGVAGYASVNTAATALYRALGRLRSLRELDERERLSEAELEMIEESLRRELLSSGPEERGGDGR